MIDVLIKALGFVIVIIIGFALKQFKILRKEDGYILATIIMNVTLPCALFSNANGITINAAMIVLIVIGILMNVMMVIVGYLTSAGKPAPTRAAYMINCSGYNIGNFVLPFVQAFFPGMGVAYLCMFDVGNALMGLGGTFAIASSIVNKQEKLSVKNVAKKLFSSIPFDVYIIIFFLALFKIRIPDGILLITNFIGAGNGFLAMLMIGLLLEIKISPSDFKDLIKILGIRLLGNFSLMFICYMFLPLPLLARQILTIALAAPISTVAAVFTKQCRYEGEVAAVANSISILIGIGVLVLLLLLFV
ncbi:AEC family transporter [uncultured Thomasclavelia sp.]|uniref:AEC family transporter n=1 Tax=uncultured Thomasclavelia sp. TaxID=3025759 RepID=UPI0025D94BD1|nr:AEC family transporter [uncultured Thomasclavelia sp.]